MVKETIDPATKNVKFDNLIILKLPKNIAAVLRLNKAFVIENEKSRFGKWIFIF